MSEVAQSCPTLCDPMDCSMPGFPVQHQIPELAQLTSIKSVRSSNHLILCRSFLLPSSIFPSSMVFSKESVLRIRWLKYWSFSFSISPSNECSGLISLKTGWLDILAVQGTQESSPVPQFEGINSLALCILYGSVLKTMYDH